ncbi:YgiW/YdeI family stress tolerance OB fold protein [Morganella morganii subsp. sibonii]
MNKTIVAILLGLASFGTFAANQSGGFSGPGVTSGQPVTQGGFVGGTQSVTTVEQAKQLRDDAWVTLEGNIISRIGHERYQFKDSTGVIVVDIDDKYWNGQNATPDTKIRIEGEMDKDWTELEVDVKRLTIIR